MQRTSTLGRQCNPHLKSYVELDDGSIFLVNFFVESPPIVTVKHSTEVTLFCFVSLSEAYMIGRHIPDHHESEGGPGILSKGDFKMKFRRTFHRNQPAVAHTARKVIDNDNI